MTVIAYLPALSNGFIWDDDQYVTENQTLRSLDGLRRIWLVPSAVPQYYPLTFTSFWMEYHLWGLEPFGYHLVNVLLHAANAVLLWLILRRLGVPGAWVGAAIFALHPMQVESVAWITERKNVLSGVFFFAAFLAYLRAEAPDGATGPDRTRWRPYLAAGALFAGALLSKTVTCSLPAVLLLVIWWQGRAIDRRTVLRLLPLFAVGAIMAAVTVWMERYHVGAQGEDFHLSSLDRALVAGRALWFYPGKLLWPRDLAFIYPRWTIDPHVWWQYLFPAAALAVIGALYLMRRRIGRGPLVATLCYAGTLVPALGFINVYPMRFSFVADHFAYLSIGALIVLLGAGTVSLVDRVAARWRSAARVVVAASVLLCLGLLAARQCATYRDSRTLWTDTLAKNPRSWLAHDNLHAILKNPGNEDVAIEHYRAALQVNPNAAEEHYGFGIALVAKGQVDDAIAHFREALRLQPDFLAARLRLGNALLVQGKMEEARKIYEELVAKAAKRPSQ